MSERFDAVVVGGGMSGLPLALRLARHGRVAMAEGVNAAAGGVHRPSTSEEH